MNKAALLILVLIGAPEIVFAQAQAPDNRLGSNGDNLNIPSSNAAQFGTYGQVPVNLFNGTAGVQVPIYTLRYRELSVPIGLSYNYTGFRPNEHPSWAGLGWVLNAGGTITRVRHGEADELRLPLQPTGSPGSLSYMGSQLRAARLSHADEPGFTLSDYKSLIYAQGFRNLDQVAFTTTNLYYFDTAPDEFVFNFAGYSGKIFYTNTGQWVVQSDNAAIIKAEPKMVSNLRFVRQTQSHDFVLPQAIIGFNLTLPDGTVYYFGEEEEWPTDDDNHVAYEISFGTPDSKYGGDYNSTPLDGWAGNNFFTSAWHLKKIRSSVGTEINFEYGYPSTESSVEPNFELQRANVNNVDRLFTNFKTYAVSVTSCRRLMAITAGTIRIDVVSGPTYHDKMITEDFCMAKHEEVEPDFFSTLTKEHRTLFFNFTKMGQNFMNKRATRDQQVTISEIAVPANDYYVIRSIVVKDGNNLLQKTDFETVGNIRPTPSGQNPASWPCGAAIQGASETGRMQLQSISTFDGQQNIIGRYKFDYYEPPGTIAWVPDASSPKLHPSFPNRSYDINPWEIVPYGTRMVDHAGYYNKKDFLSQYPDTAYVQFDIPTTSNPNPFLYTQYYNSREPDFYCTRMGALKRIIYPTGGTSTFEYELNSYSRSLTVVGGSIALTNPTSTPTTGCGLRIKKITSVGSTDPAHPEYTLGSEPITKEYLYVSDYTAGGTASSGILNGSKPEYFRAESPPSVYKFGVDPDPSPSQTATITCHTWTNSPRHMLFNEGGFLNYSEVVERNGDGSYKIYKYSNHDQAQYINTTFNVPNPNAERVNGFDFHGVRSKIQERGKLLGEYYYTSSNELVRSVAYSYNNDPNRFSQKINSMERQGYIIKPFNYWSVGNYCLKAFVLTNYYYNVYLQERTETNYYNGGSIATTTRYEVDGDRNITKVSTVTDGVTHITETRFSNTVNPQGVTGPLAAGYLLLRQKSITNAPVEIVNRQINAVNDEVVTGATLHTYRSDWPRLASKSSLRIAAPVSALSFTPFSNTGSSISTDSRYREDFSITRFTGTGLPSESFEKTMPKAVLYGHNQELPIAVAQNAWHDDIAYTSFENAAVFDDQGGWIYDGYPIQQGGGVGNKFFKFTTTQTITSFYSLSTGRKYRLTFWTKDGAAPAIAVNGTTITPQPTQTTMWDGASTWHYFSVEFTSTGTGINIFRPGQQEISLDDLRLCPANATIQTMVYDPALSTIIATSDNQGHLKFFDYDGQGRLVAERDQQRAIVRKIDYGLQTTQD